ncbi:MAG: hypothetical protein JO233_09775 [Candidatus Eremiobacteraeota bacterium]|nr:hypothetical protein [Candidatus Eremiobacteraeota bacterium]
MDELSKVEHEISGSRAALPSWMPLSLLWAERLVFFVVGVLLFVAALALAGRSIQILANLFSTSVPNTVAVPGSVPTTVSYTAEFLDMVLLILMIVEIAYTVSLSLRGAMLRAQPFLIVGLIAVIRRVLVLTVQEVRDRGTLVGGGLISRPNIELAALALVVMVFVVAIYLLRNREPLHE